MKSILIVEDDAPLRGVIRMALTLKGFTVHEAENGQTALDLLGRTEPPGMILLDLMMPVMDGWEFTEKVIDDPKLSAIPIIVLTAYASKGESLAVRRILKKPVDVEDLIAIATELCGGP